jgi:hypothetical protein
LKNRDGKAVEIRLTECKLCLDTTRTFWDKKGNPPTVRCTLGATLEYDGLVIPSPDGATSIPKRTGQSIDITYDVTGKWKRDK